MSEETEQAKQEFEKAIKIDKMVTNQNQQIGIISTSNVDIEYIEKFFNKEVMPSNMKPKELLVRLAEISGKMKAKTGTTSFNAETVADTVINLVKAGFFSKDFTLYWIKEMPIILYEYNNCIVVAPRVEVD